MEQYRCTKCNKRLFDYDISDGQVEIICPRCGKFNVFKKKAKEKFIINENEAHEAHC